MNKVSKLTLVLISSSVFCLSTANAYDYTRSTFVGPSLRANYTNPINSFLAYSVLGEAGFRNFRVGSTLGFRVQDNQRFKLSAEYLWQEATYSYFTGNTNLWMQQVAVGGEYQYDLAYNWNPQLDLNAYISYAPSKSLRDVSGFTTSGGVISAFTNVRRVAGSSAVGLSPGVTVELWEGSKFGVDLNYDNVRYYTNFQTGLNATGFGGTARMNQVITDDISFGASAALRKPYNNYQANLDWANLPYIGSWSLGLFGEYTVGRSSLGNSYDAGLTANYSPEFVSSSAGKKHRSKVRNTRRDNFMHWVANPAVYMPQVLAIADQKVNLVCSGTPGLLSVISPKFISTFGLTTFATAYHFAGAGFTYSLNFLPDESPNGTDGTTISINPQTGLVSVSATEFGMDTFFDLTVTATSPCGTVTTPPFLVEVFTIL